MHLTFFHASHLLEPGTGKYPAATGTAMVLAGSAPMDQSGTAEDWRHPGQEDATWHRICHRQS